MDDERETPVNPYQSPRSDSDAEKYLPGPDKAYGLKEPIRIQGKLSAEDYREKTTKTATEKIKAALWILFALAVFVVMGVNLLMQGASVNVLGVFVIVGALILLAVWLLVLFGRRSFRKHVERRAVLETTTFTEEGIVAEAEQGRTAFSWSAFCGCKCSEHRVLLYLEPNGNHIIYPKRFFASEEGWELFVGLVRCKVPEDKDLVRRTAGKPGRRLAPEPAGGRALVDAPSREGGRPLLRLAGAITWHDWKHVRRKTGILWRGRLVRVGCLLPFMILVGFMAFTHGFRRGWPGWLAPAVIALLLFFFLFVWPAVKLRRQWTRREGPFEPFEVRIWDDGMESVGPASVAMIPWSAIDRFTRSESLLLVHQEKLGLIRFIPRSFCSTDDQWQTLLRLMHENVPEK